MRLKYIGLRYKSFPPLYTKYMPIVCNARDAWGKLLFQPCEWIFCCRRFLWHLAVDKQNWRPFCIFIQKPVCFPVYLYTPILCVTYLLHWDYLHASAIFFISLPLRQSNEQDNEQDKPKLDARIIILKCLVGKFHLYYSIRYLELTL